jgi:hypothetical protein
MNPKVLGFLRKAKKWKRELKIEPDKSAHRKCGSQPAFYRCDIRGFRSEGFMYKSAGPPTRHATLPSVDISHPELPSK